MCAATPAALPTAKGKSEVHPARTCPPAWWQRLAVRWARCKRAGGQERGRGRTQAMQGWRVNGRWCGLPAAVALLEFAGLPFSCGRLLSRRLLKRCMRASTHPPACAKLGGRSGLGWVGAGPQERSQAVAKACALTVGASVQLVRCLVLGQASAWSGVCCLCACAAGAWVPPGAPPPPPPSASLPSVTFGVFRGWCGKREAGAGRKGTRQRPC